MIFDSMMTACCVAEMRRELAGARIIDVRQPARLELCLSMETPRGERRVAISADPRYARTHITDERPPASATSSPFGVFAAKHLRGALLTGVCQVGFDRIVRIAVEPRNPRLVDPARSIVVEIMGKHSNIILLNNVDMVLEAAKHITANMSRARTVLPHDEYVSPPARGTANPLAADEAGFLEMLSRLPADDTKLPDALLRLMEGANKLPILEALHQAAVDPSLPSSLLEPAIAARLATALGEVFGRVAAERFAPVCWDADGGKRVHYPFRLEHISSAVEPVDSLGRAIGRQVDAERSREEGEARGRQVLSLLRRARKGCAKRLAKLERSGKSEEDVELLRQTGDSILAALHSIPPHANRVRIANVHSPTAECIDVEFNPERPPAANAEGYFRRYRAGREARKRLPALVRQARADLDELDELTDRAGTTADADWNRLWEDVKGHRLVSRSLQTQGRSGGGDERRFLSCASGDGFEIIIGKSAAESDQMLRTIARPDDIWLHARDIHGGHVLIRTNRHPERVPMATILEAAAIAAFYCKAKHSSLVPVDYTLKKHVRRARKGAPGLQIYERSKTVMVEPKRPTMD